MGAIVKNINVHGDNLQHLLDYGENNEKTSLEANGLDNLLSYAANPAKTTIQLPDEDEQSILVTGILCEPNTANEEFAKLRNLYRENNSEYLTSSKKPITAVHIVQSFDDPNLDPRVVHEIGVELCRRLGVQAVVDTHMNTGHFHNHLIINAYMPDCMTKFYMNNDKRIELRRLSDEIQREYGLEVSFLDPELQQKISKNRALNYKEWQSKRDGMSWKEQMREDIAVARDITSTAEEFIEVMQDYGYIPQARKGNESILWLHTETNRTVWDSTLGKEFMLKELFSDEKAIHDIEIETERSQKSNYHKPMKLISLAKYDHNGRRRTEIELLIRRAIAIIQTVNNFISNHKNKKLAKYNTKAKLDMMQEALATLKDFGIENIDDLNNNINLAGKNLSVAKADADRINGEMKYYSVLKNAIDEYKDAKTLYDSVKIWNTSHDDLHVNVYSKRDVSHAIAQIAPLSSKQKSELYQMMQKRPNLRLVDAGKNYTNISVVQFQQIKDFLRGTGPQPDCLSDVSSTTSTFAYERQYDFLSKKFTYEPSKFQKNRAKQLLHAHGFDDVNTETLTMADIINIDNCYSENPFSSPLIDVTQQQILQTKLQTNNKTISRDISQVMECEYNQILEYLDGKVKKIPNVMKDSGPASETDIEKAKTLAAKKGFTSSVDIDAMSKSDVRDFYNWMVSQNQNPMCTNKATQATWQQNKDIFHSEIACETPRKQEVLIALRNAENALQQLGIDKADIPKVLPKITELQAEQQTLTDEKTECAEHYKQLLRLKQQTMYAKDKNFLFGSLFTQTEIKDMEAQLQDYEKAEKEEQTQEQQEQTQEQQEQAEKENEARTQRVDKLISKLTNHHSIDNDIDL